MEQRGKLGHSLADRRHIWGKRLGQPGKDCMHGQSVALGTEGTVGVALVDGEWDGEFCETLGEGLLHKSWLLLQAGYA